MKIQPEHYAHMRAAIANLDADAVRAHRAALADDPRVRDLAKRFRWDLSYAARLTPWICDTVYPYANDTHVDTALRRIVDELYP